MRCWAVIAFFGLMMFGAAQAQAQARATCSPGAVCDDAVPKPRNIFEFNVILRPVVKAIKPQVVVKPKKPSITLAKPKTAPVKTKVAQQKPKLKPSTPTKRLPAVKVTTPKPSWDQLPEVPVTTLLAQDFLDVDGQYIVDLNLEAFRVAGLDISTISASELAIQLSVAPNQIRSVQRRFLLSVVLNATPEQAARLARSPFVRAVHKDTKIKAAGGKVPLSWGLDRLDSPSLPLDGAFDREFGDYDSRIYLFDQGVEAEHDEFGGRVKFGASFIKPSVPTHDKCRAHGTEMAALVAGATTGSAPKAEVVELVILPCSRNETGEASSLIEAIEWLLIREADFGDGKPAIANMSLTGKWSRKINNAISVLTENGVAVVVAAGNNAQDACRFSPASAKDAITVAATDANDKTPGFSNFGQCVDIHAPGRLLTTLTESKTASYVAVNGTSGAAALVSGLLARSLKEKGPKAASNWLAEAGAPAKYWRSDQVDVILAQASSSWRNLCRTGGTKGFLTLRSSPQVKGKQLQILPKGTLVTVKASTNQWAQVSIEDGTTGWVVTKIDDKAMLLDLNGVEACQLAP